MTLNTQQIIELLTIIGELRGVKVCVTQSLRGGMITGGAACVGSLVLGPAGLIIGAVVGSLTAISSGEDYRSLPVVLMNDLTDAHREEITIRINRIIADLDITDLGYLVVLAKFDNLVEIALKELGSYLRQEMSYSLKY